MSGFDPKMALLGALSVITVFYLAVLGSAILKARRNGETLGSLLFSPKSGWLYFTGAFTNFFDTLGVGSFAPTTAIFRKWRLVPDERIPGTLNIGHTLPTIAQAFIFTTAVSVDPLTLVYMILAAVAGSYIGSGLVAGWPRQRVQLGMGLALAVAALLMFASVMNWMPVGGNLIGLEGNKLLFGLLGNFVLGSLMTIGIGLYAPCMVLVSLLGMSPITAFPIMMGSCAFLMPVASYRFVKKDFFDLKAALGLAIGGLPLVLVAALVVKSLPLDYMKVLVVIVVLYTSYGLLKSSTEKELQPIEDGIAPSPVP